MITQISAKFSWHSYKRNTRAEEAHHRREIKTSFQKRKNWLVLQSFTLNFSYKPIWPYQL
jgi:hypothetical protein